MTFWEFQIRFPKKPVKMAFNHSFSCLTQKRAMGSAWFSFMRVKGRAKFESESRHLYSCVLATETKSKAKKAGSRETWNPYRYLCHDICLTYKQDKKHLFA